jgi:hypothetical protein
MTQAEQDGLSRKRHQEDRKELPRSQKGNTVRRKKREILFIH